MDRLAGDLHWFADRLLENPLDLQDCAQTVLMFGIAPNVAKVNMGEGPSLITYGHIGNLFLNLQCDYTGGNEEVTTCDEAANQPAPPEEQSGSVFNGSISFSGDLGEHQATLESTTYTVVAPTSGPDPHSFSLRALDIDIADFGAASFEFEDPSISLPDTANGSRTGTAVTFDVGVLDLNVHTKLKINGDYLFGTEYLDLVFENTSVVEATWNSGVFSIQVAEYEIGGVTAVLNTEPPT